MLIHVHIDKFRFGPYQLVSDEFHLQKFIKSFHLIHLLENIQVQCDRVSLCIHSQKGHTIQH